VDVVQVQAVVSKVVVVAQALWLTLFFNVQLKPPEETGLRRSARQTQQEDDSEGGSDPDSS